MRSRALLILLPLVAAGCAKERASQSAAPPPATATTQALPAIDTLPVASLALAQDAISRGSLRCASLRHCPAGVGMLLTADAPGGFVADSPSVSACTAVLVAPGLALTNSHCIPSAVKLLPDLCRERVRLVLPKTTQREEETLACDSLLGFSSRETAMSPDLALIRLEKETARPYLRAERGGVEGGALLRSYKIHPDLKTLTGVLASERCIATPGSYRMPIYAQPTDAALVMGDCHAIPGNSGAAVVNKSGQLVALLQADLPLSEQAKTEWGKHSAESAFAPLALATSLHCLAQDPSLGWQWTPSCVSVSEQDVALARPRIRQHLESPALVEEIGLRLAPFLAQSPFLRWERLELDTKALDRRETIRPSCYQSAPQAGLELSLEFPRVQLELRFNRYLQLLQPRAVLLSTERKAYRVSEDLKTLAPIIGDSPSFALDLCQQNP